MRDSVGSSLLLTLIIMFVSLIILFFVNILTYTKAFKAKNRIIEVIEKNKEYESSVTDINATLRDLGYQLGSCKEKGKDLNTSGYAYCVKKVCVKEIKNSATGSVSCDTRYGYYYKITTYMQFYFPIINQLYNPPVRGETKILGKDYKY